MICHVSWMDNANIIVAFSFKWYLQSGWYIRIEMKDKNYDTVGMLPKSYDKS
jgi:hypothetical protein